MKNGFKYLSVLAFFLGACATGYEDDFYLPSQTDVDILLATKAFFSDESKWTRGEETQCDLEAEAMTLFCGLQKASFDVTGDYVLRAFALEEVRYVIEDMVEGPLDRRLIDFNNLETTNFEDIQLVLDIALERVQAEIEALDN